MLCDCIYVYLVVCIYVYLMFIVGGEKFCEQCVRFDDVLVCSWFVDTRSNGKVTNVVIGTCAISLLHSQHMISSALHCKCNLCSKHSILPFISCCICFDYLS